MFLFSCLLFLPYIRIRWRGKGKKKNKEPLSRLFVLTWLFDRLSYFHYPDCSCDNYRYRCYPSNWIAQWSSKYWGQPGNCLILFEAYVHHLLPVQSLRFNLFSSIRVWGVRKGEIIKKVICLFLNRRSLKIKTRLNSKCASLVSYDRGYPWEKGDILVLEMDIWKVYFHKHCFQPFPKGNLHL